MPGPRPQDPYNPNTTVNPAVGAPSDYLNIRSNPNEFGAQVGQAAQGLGKTLEQGGNQLIDIAIQRQGMLNESMATDAETQAASQYGTLVGQYKSMEGLEAVNKLPQYVNDLQQVRQKIRATLPNAAAQRSFDLLAARREAYALQDVNLYAATQVKAADTKSANAALNLAIDQASDPSVAFNPAQFNDSLLGIKFQSARILTNMGYGADAGTGMKQEKDGSLSFDESSENGKKAKEVYDSYMQDAMGKVWTNRIDTMAFDPKQGNVQLAIQTLNENKDSIPSATYARLSAKLAPALKNAQARDVADKLLLPYQNYGADYFRANYANIVENARDQAQQLHPDDPTFADQAASRVEQRIGNVIRQQDLMTRAYQDTVMNGISGKSNNGVPLTSMDQIDHGPPELRNAYHNWLAQDPYADVKLDRLLKANQRGSASNYGHDFYRMFSEISSGLTDNPTDYAGFVGTGSDATLTNTGYNLLTKQAERMKTPEGRDFVSKELEFFNKVRGTVTATGSAPGVVTPKLYEAFNKQLAVTYNYIEEARAQGKTAADLFDPKSPEYAGRFIQPTKMSDLLQAKAEAAIAGAQATPGGAYNSVGDLQKALRSRAISRDEFNKIAIEKGWARATPPSVPQPNFEQAEKKSNAIIKAPVKSDEELEEQWKQSQINNFDYGRLKESNPLAYLGYMAVKNQGVASRFKTPLTALGLTFTGDISKKDPDYEVLKQALNEAGVDEKSAKGRILLGPEFGTGKTSTWTLEHELMHRGFMELLKDKNFMQIWPQDLQIEAFGQASNYDKHEQDPNQVAYHELASRLPLRDPSENGIKELRKTLIKDLDYAQHKAKTLIEKQNH